jgi:hypothetical protein
MYIIVNDVKFSVEQIAAAVSEKYNVPNVKVGRDTLQLVEPTELGDLTVSLDSSVWHSLYVDLKNVTPENAEKMGVEVEPENKDLATLPYDLPIAIVELPNATCEEHYTEHAPKQCADVVLFGGMMDDASHIATIYGKGVDGKGIDFTANEE